MPLGMPTSIGPAGPSGPGSNYQAPSGAVAQPAGVSPGSAYSAASGYYAPQQQYLNASQQNILAGQALNAQQLGNQQQYAQSQYNTGMSGLNLDQANINAQRAGLAGDQQYIGNIYQNNLQGNAADRRYANADMRVGNQLWAQLHAQSNLQGQLANQALQYQLARLGFQTTQARGQAANDTQALGETVGAMGAFGSRGAVQRQGFIGSSLANQLGIYGQEGNLARNQNQLTRSQLQAQGARDLAARNNNRDLDTRRLQNASIADRRAGYEYQHQGSQLNVNNQQLDIAAQRLGISRQQLQAALNNAMNNASLGYGSGLLQSQQALNSNQYQNSQLFQNIGALTGQIAGAG